MKKLVLFDLDGTLVNSLSDLADSMNHVLKNHGFEVHDTDSYKMFVGDGTLKLVERAIPKGERFDEKIKSYHSEFSLEYNKRMIEKTRPYEGIVQVLEEIKSRGYVIAVASNKPDKFAKYIVNALFGKGFFDLIYGKQDNVLTKPAPDIVYNILKKVDTNLHNTVFVGDSCVDVMTAHNAGIKCIGCSWGFRGRNELEEAGADFIADVPLDIYRYI